MKFFILGFALFFSLARASDPALTALQASLPEQGVLHLIYGRDATAANKEYFVDFTTGSILHISGSRVFLRDATGQCSRGSGADAQTGEPLGWEQDEPYFVRTLMGLPNPITQAVVLIHDWANVVVSQQSSGDWILIWTAPDSTKLVWDGSGQTQAAVLTTMQFLVSGAGRILSWQHIESKPESREGPVHFHDYTDALTMGNMSIPKFLDLKFQNRRTPEAGVWILDSAEMLDTVPPDLFTRDGALARAAEAAKPMVQAYRDSFYWHDAPNAAEKEAMPLIDPTRKKPGPSWGPAFVLSGVVVLSLGVFAWWRSR